MLLSPVKVFPQDAVDYTCRENTTSSTPALSTGCFLDPAVIFLEGDWKTGQGLLSVLFLSMAFCLLGEAGFGFSQVFYPVPLQTLAPAGQLLHFLEV